MGTCDFATVGFGADIRSAYEQACSAAVHEYGHDPYNGTISTTYGVVELPEIPGFTLVDYRNLSHAIRYDAPRCDITGLIEVPPVRRKFSNEWDRKSYLATRKLVQRYLAKVNPRDRHKIEQSIHDLHKGGPALAVVLTPKEQRQHREFYGTKGRRGSYFGFFGDASC